MNETLEAKTSFPRERTFLILLIIFSTVIFLASVKLWNDHNTPDSPGLYPALTSGGMLACLLIALFQLLRKKKDAPPATQEDANAWERLKISFVTEVPFTVFVMMIVTILYTAAISVLGFYPATFVYLTFSIFFLFKGKREKLLQSVVVSAGFLGAIYLIIQILFQIRMP
jgi:hypothetical protein